MKKIGRPAAFVSVLVLFFAATATARAEDVEKKFRVSFSAGSYSTQDKVPSDAANVAVFVAPDGGVVYGYEDPRLDSSSIGELGIQPAFRYALAGQYAFTKSFLVELSAGYQKGDVGEVDVQGMIAGEAFDTQRESFNFRPLRIDAGEMTQVPLQATAMFRFRPRSTFNPYVGLGIGYTFVGFEPSHNLDSLSLILDETYAEFSAQQIFPGGFESGGVTLEALEGARVSAPDTFEWHGVGGLEWTFKKKWSAFFELRYTFASNQFRLGFNGNESVGVSVPNGEFDLDSTEASIDYGTYFFQSGLVDAGCLVDAFATTVVPCAPRSCDPGARFGTPGSCKFQLTPDGVLDPGFYYVKGGDIKYGGVGLSLGIRYTF